MGSAKGLNRTKEKSKKAIIPPVEEDISIWYQNSDPSQSELNEEEALKALLNEMEQHVSSSSHSTDFPIFGDETNNTKPTNKENSYSDPPPVESMSDSEVSMGMVFEADPT